MGVQILRPEGGETHSLRHADLPSRDRFRNEMPAAPRLSTAARMGVDIFETKPLDRTVPVPLAQIVILPVSRW
jgi:hypothetical protein